jgi:hypothetical protein
MVCYPNEEVADIPKKWQLHVRDLINEDVLRLLLALQ